MYLDGVILSRKLKALPSQRRTHANDAWIAEVDAIAKEPLPSTRTNAPHYNPASAGFWQAHGIKVQTFPSPRQIPSRLRD